MVKLINAIRGSTSSSPNDGQTAGASVCTLQYCRAFYPLSSAGAASWPLPAYVGYGTNGVVAMPDALFGSAVLCSKASQVNNEGSNPPGGLLPTNYASRHYV